MPSPRRIKKEERKKLDRRGLKKVFLGGEFAVNKRMLVRNRLYRTALAHGLSKEEADWIAANGPQNRNTELHEVFMGGVKPDKNQLKFERKAKIRNLKARGKFLARKGKNLVKKGIARLKQNIH